MGLIILDHIVGRWWLVMDVISLPVNSIFLGPLLVWVLQGTISLGVLTPVLHSFRDFFLEKELPLTKFYTMFFTTLTNSELRFPPRTVVKILLWTWNMTCKMFV